MGASPAHGFRSAALSDHFDVSLLRGILSLREFDDKVTAYYCGFTGVDDYYDRASAAHVVERIAVPALVLTRRMIRSYVSRRRRGGRFQQTNITLLRPRMAEHCALIGRREIVPAWGIARMLL